MSDPSSSLGDLEARIARHESRVFTRTLLLVLIPVALAAIWLWTTLSAISNARSELVVVQKELSEARAQLIDLQKKLSESQARFDALQEDLLDAAKFDLNRYELDWTDAKAIFSIVGDGARVLERIYDLQQQGVGWDLSNTPEKGFHSPGFAQYVLDDLGRSLTELERTPYPCSGDVVVYETGYTMFYFKDGHGEEFVMGMTPLGILSLKYDFGPKRLCILRNE